MKLAKVDWALGGVLMAMVLGASACGSSSSKSSASNLPTKVGEAVTENSRMYQRALLRPAGGGNPASGIALRI